MIYWPFMKIRQLYHSHPRIPLYLGILFAIGFLIFAIFAMVRNFTSHGVVFLTLGVLIGLFKGWDWLDAKYNYKGPQLSSFQKKTQVQNRLLW